MDIVQLLLKMAINMKAIFIMDYYMELVSLLGQMEQYMRDNLHPTESQEKENIYGSMVHNMMEK